MYYNKLPTWEYIYLLLYIDDMLIASRSRSAIDALKRDLSSEFEMKSLGFGYSGDIGSIRTPIRAILDPLRSRGRELQFYGQFVSVFIL